MKVAHIDSRILILWVLFVTEGNTNGVVKPNVVIIMADDMGWGDVGYHGSDIATPNIDALAFSGIRLSQFYSQPSCTPSRTALLTGKYPIRTGTQGPPLLNGEPHGIPLNEKILPQYLKDLGYSTYLIGKWHVGYYTVEHCPNQRGFDSFFGYHNGFLGYYDGASNLGRPGLDAWRNRTKAWPEFFGHYLPNLINDEAVEHIKRHDATKPMFLMVSHPTPHRGNLLIGLEPPPERISQNANPDRRFYEDMVRYLDDTVGNITVTLRETNMLNNTIIIFMSDNGAPIYKLENNGSNYPFRGTKMSLYEGGIRVPAVLWWNGLENKGADVKGIFHMTDWLPTILSAAGGGHLVNGLDGIDQWNAIRSGTSTVRTEFLVDIDDVSEIEAYRYANYKLIKSYKAPERFYEDEFRGWNPQNSTYNVRAVVESKVARAIGASLDTNKIIEMRNKTRDSVSRCSTEEQNVALSRNCRDGYCLYDIEQDPTECRDIFNDNTEVANKIIFALDTLRNEMKPKINIESTGTPGDDFYWSPWIASTSGSLKPAFLRIFSILTVVFGLCM